MLFDSCFSSSYFASRGLSLIQNPSSLLIQLLFEGKFRAGRDILWKKVVFAMHFLLWRGFTEFLFFIWFLITECHAAYQLWELIVLSPFRWTSLAMLHEI